MGLSNKKEEQLKAMPTIESQFSKSADGRYIIHKTIMTTIRPVQYFEKVIADEGTEVTVQQGSDLVEDAA